MSRYQRMLERMKDRECKTGHGLGEVDDAEPGDIAYRRCPCQSCKGTGYEPRKRKKK